MAWPEVLEVRRLPATITVNSAVDDAPARDGSITLREAILIADGSLAVASLSAAEQALVSGTVNSGGTNRDKIQFAIPGSGVHTIALVAPLPSISDPVEIDGYSQSGAKANSQRYGSDATILIQISAGGSSTVLQLDGGGSLVRGLAIGGGDVGVVIRSDGNVVEGCYLGVSASGDALAASFSSQVWVVTGTGNLIGGATPAARNVIAGGSSNGAVGMVTVGNTFDSLPAPVDTRIWGNDLGLNAAGTAALGGTTGIAVAEGMNTRIGADDSGDGATDDTASAGNVISGVGGPGILVQGPGSADVFDGLTIQGNRLGTDPRGQSAIPNSGVGIQFSSSTPLQHVRIGGSTNRAGNVISGSGVDGIQLGLGDFTIQGNLIGTDVSGSRALPNTGYGIAVSGDGNPGSILIGGTAPNAGNLISGNGTAGIGITAAGIHSLDIQGNKIGTNASGNLPIPNGTDGITAYDGPSRIGGTAAGAGNVIAFNTRAGIAAGESPAGVGRTYVATILGNSIFGNGTLGIDLGGVFIAGGGATANDPTDSDVGPNDYQNFPVMTSVTRVSGGTRIIGSLQSLPNKTYTIQIFGNDAVEASGHVQGKTLLSTFAVTTDSSGAASFDRIVADSSSVAFGATATDDAGKTSEFGGVTAPPPAASADVSVSASASVSSARPGDQITYRFVVTVPSGGPSPTNPSLTIPIPAGTHLVGFAVPNSWTSLGSDAMAKATATQAGAGSSLTFSLVVQVDSGIADGRALVARGAFASGTPDPNAANDSASARVVASNPTSPPTPETPSASIGSAAYSQAEGNSGTRFVEIPVALSSAPTSNVTLRFQVVGGSAAAGSDFLIPDDLTLSFTPGGPLTQVIRVAVIGDATVEPDETFQVALVAGDGYTLGGLTSTTVTIVNDDVAPIPPPPSEPSPPPADVVAPSIVAVRRYGIHHQPTTLTVTFTEPVAGATNPTLYRIVDPGRDRRFGTRDDSTFTASNVDLDAAGATATLHLARQLNLHLVYRLNVGAGIADASGNALAGDSSFRIDASNLGVATRRSRGTIRPLQAPAVPRAAHKPIAAHMLLQRRPSAAHPIASS